MSEQHEYDYIIVGAGSAGCVLAERLSADPDNRVLLLEAGGRDRHPFIHMPAGISKLASNRTVNWAFETEPVPALHDRRLYWPRGKVLGGSSSINAMCYVRGQPRDYDEWAEAGNRGWSFDEVLPYFKRAENNQRGADAYHATSGPLSVSDLKHVNPLSGSFLRAAEQAGYARNADFNGPRQEGFGYYQVTQHDGRRCSAAAAYLASARLRSNLTVLTRAYTQRVLVDDGRATGVRFRRAGRSVDARAAREVILAAGAVQSPQLLLLSGIGPADELRAHELPVAVDLPGVGKNLQDHLDICTLRYCRRPITYDQLNEVYVALRYFLFHTGIGTSNIAEAGGFVQSGLADGRPDMQFHFVPALLDDHGRNRMPGYGMTIHACALAPESRGEIRLRSADPATPPAIHPNYLASERDMQVMLEGARRSRELFAQPAFDAVRGTELFPGEDIASDEELRDFIRWKAETIYHPACTCRMGVDEQAVVTPELQVRGIEGLRVADASVMPTLVRGNTNAPTIMIAERASDLIRGETETPVDESDRHAPAERQAAAV